MQRVYWMTELLYMTAQTLDSMEKTMKRIVAKVSRLVRSEKSYLPIQQVLSGMILISNSAKLENQAQVGSRIK